MADVFHCQNVQLRVRILFESTGSTTVVNLDGGNVLEEIFASCAKTASGGVKE